MPRREPERTCIVTRRAAAPAELIRFVVAPDGEVVADLKGRLPGRGAWVTATRRRGPAGGGAPRLRPRLQGGGQGRARSPRPDRRGAAAGLETGLVARQQGRRGRERLHQGRDGDPRRRDRGAPPCRGSRRGRAQKARGSIAKTFRRRDIGHTGHCRAHRRRIGFGIGPVTCDTCWPRRGRRERRFSRALAQAMYLPRVGGRSNPDSKGSPAVWTLTRRNLSGHE